jgi:hypothetical protein
VIRGTLISILLLTCYALARTVSNRKPHTAELQGRLARADAVLAKICYPLCLLIHIAGVSLMIASVISGWREGFPLGIAMSIAVLGGLGLVALWCSLAFVPSWFSNDRARTVIQITLIVSLVELILGMALYIAVTVGVLP